MTTRTRPRLVSEATEPTLAEQIAAYHRIEREQAALKARIMAAGRKIARDAGEWGVVSFERICREHGRG